MDEPRLTSDALPEMLAYIAKVSDSVQTALLVAEKLGNSRMWIPEKMRRDHPLAKLIGMKLATLVARRYGGEKHTIPTAIHLRRFLRARQLRRLGKTKSEIARELGIGVRRVEYLISGIVVDPKADQEPDTAISFCPTCGRRPARHRCKQRDDRQLSLL